MRLLAFSLTFFAIVEGTLADDIEAYVPVGDTSPVFVQVVMDIGDTDQDRTLCTMGVDCAPPFLTPAAYRQLSSMYASGEAVTAPGIFKSVLAALAENPLFGDLHLGLLISNHPDNTGPAMGATGGGGTLLSGAHRLAHNRQQLLETVKSIPVVAGNRTHVLQPREGYFEWLRYIRGGKVARGTSTAGNFGQSMPIPDYDMSIVRGDDYVSPVSSRHECPRLFSILFRQRAGGRDNDLDVAIASETPLPGDASLAQFLAYLHGATTDLVPGVPARVALTQSWLVGSHQYPGDSATLATVVGANPVLFVDAPVDLEHALTRALEKILSPDGTISSTTYVDDVARPGNVLDRAYISMFQAQGGSNWPGNIKKLKLETAAAAIPSSIGTLRLVDALGHPAFEPGPHNGARLRFDALSYWTDRASLPPGDGVSVPLFADGAVVARGGAGQKIDGFTPYSTQGGVNVEYYIGHSNSDPEVNGYGPRQVYVEPASGQVPVPLNADVTTAGMLSEWLDPEDDLTTDELVELIGWGRGLDPSNPGSMSRSWLTGEVLHSRPVALNYGAIAGYSRINPYISVLFGSGEGAFHILQDTLADGAESGREVFAFFPRDTLHAIKHRRNGGHNSGLIPYGVDGAPVVLTNDHNSDGKLEAARGDEAFVYFGMRRGGSSYFALNISDPEAVPSVQWKISPTSGGDFDELGMSFSTPVLGKVNFEGQNVDVLIFSGGYDGGWNDNYSARLGKDNSAADSVVGNAIYIVDARTGNLVWKAIRGNTGDSSNTHFAHDGLVDSIPSAVSVLTDTTGVTHRVYVGDTGGAVWRVDLPPNLASSKDHRRDNWFITKLADLGFDAGEVGGGPEQDRRFFHPPDIVRSFDATGKFDGVLITSGDRAHPNERVAENYLFYIKDREVKTASAQVRSENSINRPVGRLDFVDLVDQSLCVTGAEVIQVAGKDIPCGSRILEYGWKMKYERDGEKGMSRPLTDGGRVFASTFYPGRANVCPKEEGRAGVYVLHLRDGSSVTGSKRFFDLGTGIPEAPSAVGDAIHLPGRGIDLLENTPQAGVPLKLLPSIANKLYSLYWREPGADVL